VDLIVVVVIVTAIAFDFTNGFHDTANAMATSIATGALRPRVAVGIAAALNVVGAFLSTEVALTISSGIVNDTRISPAVIFGGLVGAIMWNLITWLFGLPSSSSHALIGGLVGATWIVGGPDAVRFANLIKKVIVPAIASPLIAVIVAGTGTFVIYRIVRLAREDVAHKGFRWGQVGSASLVSLAHGTNDAQKTMGVITLVLISAGTLPTGARPPIWVILISALAIAAGTYTGGWRIIRTVGHRLSDVESPQGFSAEGSSAAVILSSTHLGYALSTTQVVTGSVVGSGIGKSGDVRWRVAGQIAIAWVLTLPAAGVIGAGAGKLASLNGLGVLGVALIGVAAATGIYLLSRRNVVNSRNVNTPRPAVKPTTATGGGAHLR
jgi:PiT family inorganic phosphate transporter